MRFNSLSPIGQRPLIIWLRVTHAGGLGAAAATWALRMRTFLPNRQLLSANAPRRIAMLHRGVSATAFEPVDLMFWCLAQPEAVLVSVQGRAASDIVLQDVAHE